MKKIKDTGLYEYRCGDFVVVGNMEAAKQLDAALNIAQEDLIKRKYYSKPVDEEVIDEVLKEWSSL